MTLTPSNMMPLGTVAPDFLLTDTCTNTEISLEDAKGNSGTLVMFICNHCPYVKHIQAALGHLGEDFKDTDINIIAISSNDAKNYPEDSPENMKIFAQKNNFSFPYLYDKSQEVAKAYGAACTPDFFLFDEGLRCVYRGQFDNSRPGNGVAVSGRDLREAMDALLNKQPINSDQKASIGCNIKWK